MPLISHIIGKPKSREAECCFELSLLKRKPNRDKLGVYDAVVARARDKKGRLKGIRMSDSRCATSTPGFIENANVALNRAERYFEESNYSCSIKEAQTCLEQTIKGLSIALGIEYPRDHDVSDEIKLIIDSLSRRLQTGELASIQNKMMRAGLLSKMLSKMRLFAIYGDEKLGIAADVLFSGDFGKKITEPVLSETDIIYRCVTETIERLLGSLC